MRRMERRKGRARPGQGRRDGALANPLDESFFPEAVIRCVAAILHRGVPGFGLFAVAVDRSGGDRQFFMPGIGLAETISSALTHPGVPTAKRVFAREASSRAVLLSPRR